MRWPFALLLYLAVALTISFGWIGSSDVHPMEGIVADGAREMVRSDQYAVPRLHGELYTYEPPLAYWLAAIPLRLWDGETEWTLRVPFALCSVLLGGAVLWLAGRVLGPGRGLTCALAALTGGLALQVLHRADFGMPLALGVGLAAAAAASNLASERQRAPLWWLCYLGLAGGFLAKGAAALMVFAPGLLLAAIATGRLRALARPSHLAGVALFLLVTGGWVYAAVEAAGWEAFDRPLAEAADKGFAEWSWTTFAIALGKPLLAVALLLPWSILLPIVLRRRWWRGLEPRERRLARCAAAFLVAGSVSFIIVPTAESRYLLQLAAPAGILLGMATHAGRRAVAEMRVVDRGAPALTGALALAAIAVALGPWPAGAPLRVLAAALGVAAAALLVAARKRPPAAVRAPLILAAALCVWVVHTAVLEPARAARRSLRAVAEAFAPHLAADEILWTTPVAKGFHHSALFFYLGRQVRTTDRYARPAPGSALVLFSDQPSDRPEYAVPVEYAVVATRRHRRDDFVLARTGAMVAPPRAALTPAGILEVMRRAADWQLAHPRHEPRDWTNAVFYTGLLAAHRATGEARYLDELLRLGEEHSWRPGPRERHADDHAIAQTYLDLYRIRPHGRMIAPFREVADRMMASPPRWPKAHQTIDYWWSDALFMSPPAFAKLARVTGERRYLEFTDRLWRQAYELLYDREERLFHRDARQIAGRRGSFWSRGNAWVLAGIARLLEELPADQAERRFYLAVFGEMAERIAGLQAGDGLWRADLLASPLAAPGESSGTALFCYALARGLEQGVLDRERYLPVVRRAWSALYANVSDEGRLGWVQAPGIRPGVVRAEDWEVYGTGALLLAGEAMLGLRDGEPLAP